MKYVCLGRTDVGRAQSLGELNTDGNSVNTSSTQSLNVSQRFGSLFNPLRWSRRDINATNGSTAAVVAPRTLHHKGRGPAARKCHRSTSHLNNITNCPQSISPASSVFFVPPATPPMISSPKGTAADDTTATKDFALPVLFSPGREHRRSQQPPPPPPLSPRLGARFQHPGAVGGGGAILPSQLTPAAF